MSFAKMLSAIWSYARIFLALPFVAGIAFAFGAFIPLSDDFGNPIYQSPWLRGLFFTIGIVSFVLSFYIAIPGLFRLNSIKFLKKDFN